MARPDEVYVLVSKAHARLLAFREYAEAEEECYYNGPYRIERYVHESRVKPEQVTDEARAALLAMIDEVLSGQESLDSDDMFRLLKEVRAQLIGPDQRTEKALETLHRFGQIDGEHHKAWCVDQVVRALTGDGYEQFVKDYCNDGEWRWEVGIAP